MDDDFTIADAKAEIMQERDLVDVKPYSHNIIGLILSQVASVYGDDAAEKLIEECELKEKGW